STPWITRERSPPKAPTPPPREPPGTPPTCGDWTHRTSCWAGGGASRTLAVLNPETRQVTFSAQPRSLPGTRSVPLVDAQARTAAIGSVGLRYGTDPAVVDLKSFAPTAVRGPVVYANTNNGPVTMD